MGCGLKRLAHRRVSDEAWKMAFLKSFEELKSFYEEVKNGKYGEQLTEIEKEIDREAVVNRLKK